LKFQAIAEKTAKILGGYFFAALCRPIHEARWLIVVTRRHVGGIIRAIKNKAKMRKSEILRPLLFADRVFRLAYSFLTKQQTHGNYELRRNTDATSNTSNLAAVSVVNRMT